MIRQKGEQCNIGDFLQLSDNPATYLEVQGGEFPHYAGVVTDDPSKWIGGKNYNPKGVPIVNAAQRDMGPYRIEGGVPDTVEEWLKYHGLAVVDGFLVTASGEEALVVEE